MADKPQTPPQKPAAPPLPQPKVSLRQLDDEFTRDIDDEGLDPLVRLWAGRLHQLLIHLRILRVAVRDLTLTQQQHMQEIGEHFEGVTAILARLTPQAAPGGEGPPPEDDAAAPAEAENDPAEAAPPPPPVPLRPQGRRPRPGAAGGAS